MVGSDSIEIPTLVVDVFALHLMVELLAGHCVSYNGLQHITTNQRLHDTVVDT